MFYINFKDLRTFIWWII